MRGRYSPASGVGRMCAEALSVKTLRREVYKVACFEIRPKYRDFEFRDAKSIRSGLDNIRVRDMM